MLLSTAGFFIYLNFRFDKLFASLFLFSIYLGTWINFKSTINRLKADIIKVVREEFQSELEIGTSWRLKILWIQGFKDTVR